MSAANPYTVTWEDAGREPQMPANPKYPDGIDLDISKGASPLHSCRVALPYPAKRCGTFHIDCHACGQRVMCTTAGRADDPRSITMACKVKPK